MPMIRAISSKSPLFGRHRFIADIGSAIYALVAEDIDFSALCLSYGAALRILLTKSTGK